MGKICDPPPFTGGQCAKSYLVGFACESWGIFSWSKMDTGYSAGDVEISPWDNANQAFPVLLRVLGPIKSISFSGRFAYINDELRYSIPLPFGDGARNLRLHVLKTEDGSPDDCGDPPSNCRCSTDSCRVDCADAPDGFCCIPHSLTNGLLQLIQN